MREYKEWFTNMTETKPKHYHNPNIIDEENGKRPNRSTIMIPLVILATGTKTKNISWDLFRSTIKSGTAREKEMRKYLRDKYKDPNQRKYLVKKKKLFQS